MAKYKSPTIGDLLVHEESAIVCREGMTLANAQSVDILVEVGYPVGISGTLILAGDEGDTKGLCLENVAIAASANSKHEVGYLARGPAAINKDKIATVDSAGSPLDVAAIVAALEAVGITIREEPVVTETQTN